MTFFMIGFLGLWFLFNVWQYHKLVKWKKQLKEWQEQNQDRTELLLAWRTTLVNRIRLENVGSLEKWERDLSHREKVWNDLKDKIEKDSKWKLKN
ncbi:hypothetical protein AB6E39_05925 [Vibrio splendidus]|uniref:hypothetical protein n=1 Tax=Vibrio splendidus TaxID=29497 RepID=UPI001E35E58B|nr:hypothetical protein [Vibrio splendidus]MCC4787513.1 hypothetical protein [Vibrio splendidus]